MSSDPEENYRHSREEMGGAGDERVIPRRHRYPHSIVWTPLPCITWLFPVIGHMGIGTSTGVVRDFAGSYFVSEDDMAFGWPTMYWQLDLSNVPGGASAWDKAVEDASEEYGHHTHNLFCDNCHSHVALALNKMGYDNSRSWNMFKVAAGCMFKGRFIGVSGFLKQWLPFLIIAVIVVIVALILPVINA